MRCGLCERTTRIGISLVTIGRVRGSSDNLSLQTDRVVTIVGISGVRPGTGDYKHLSSFLNHVQSESPQKAAREACLNALRRAGVSAFRNL